MDTSEIRIVQVDTIEGCTDHERLQNIVWGYDPPRGVPSELLIALAHNGGLVLNAYADTEIVGLLLGVVALHDGALAHHSHILGVHPAWRGHGIGAAMKWRQREFVLTQGIEMVTWTFDPLETVNARLNVAQLGGIVRTYRRDYYGAMDDALNRGIPSDRFTLEWLLGSPRVRDRAAGIPQSVPSNLPICLSSTINSSGQRWPDTFVEPTEAATLLEVPARMQELKRQDMALALEWRLATRAAFEQLFDQGYVVTGVVHRDDRVYYYLEMNPHLSGE